MERHLPRCKCFVVILFIRYMYVLSKHINCQKWCLYNYLMGYIFRGAGYGISRGLIFEVIMIILEKRENKFLVVLVLNAEYPSKNFGFPAGQGSRLFIMILYFSKVLSFIWRYTWTKQKLFVDSPFHNSTLIYFIGLLFRRLDHWKKATDNFFFKILTFWKR